ncbi:nicotinamide riboside kinase 2 [Choristoneura fumiferana]|uniref:nicotinamide riboside kinase 2 n=1 Tax=Choristoneura fumiferana TaxID=7141 RepID=UPI003D155877
MEIKNRNEWLVIGISGVTCGGKTTLANRLVRALTPAYVFHQDQYFFPDDSPHHVRCEGLPVQHNNYDILSALDMKAMYSDVLATMAGEDRSHGKSLERENKLEVRGKKILIAEGFTVLNYKPFMELCDLRYYFILEYGECAVRRALRVYSPPDVPDYFDKCVWPEHLRYRAEMERDPRVNMIEGTRPDTLELVLADLAARGAQPAA